MTIPEDRIWSRGQEKKGDTQAERSEYRINPAAFKARLEDIGRNPQQLDDIWTHKEHPSEKKKHVSRRTLLSGAAVSTAAAGLGIFSARKTNTPELKKPGETAPEATHAQTLVETGLIVLSGMIGGAMMSQLRGIPVKDLDKPDDGEAVRFGNANVEEIKKFIFERPVRGTAAVVMLGPIAEEFSYRLLPSLAIDAVLGQGAGTVWEIGVPANFVFADRHNIKEDGSHSQNYIPLPQLVLGLFFWHLMRQRGFSHAVAGHMFSNALGLAALFATEYREHKKKEQKQTTAPEA